MSPAHVLEPTYHRLKRALMDGMWPCGAKLEAMRLAEDFGVSMTPVRDSLNQLVGEGLVDLTPGEGFRVVTLTEQTLRDLLEMNALLLKQASGAGRTALSKPEPASNVDEYADRIARVFSLLAAKSSNRILEDFVTRIGERLHPVRRHEPEVLPNALKTLAELEDSLAGSERERRQVLTRYHRNCQVHIPLLVSLVGS